MTPFTVTINPSATTAKTLTVSWRVVSQAAAAAAPATANQKDAKNQPPPRVDFAYEDMNTFTVPSGAKGAERISPIVCGRPRRLRRVHGGQEPSRRSRSAMRRRRRSHS